MKRLSVLVACMILLLAAAAHAAGAEADAIVGEWFTDGDESVVEIARVGDLYSGKIVWLKEPKDEDDNDKVDQYNPDESKRDQAIIGLEIVRDFKYDKRSRWSGGTIYDPEAGKTYSCKAKLKKTELHLRGYIGVSLLGRTTVWVRNEGNLPE